jgi:DNA-binding NtrC family response regulator
MADRQTTPGAHRRGVAPRDDDGVARQVARRQSAEALHRAGRHAAAERLLLEVAGALLRRGAPGPAAESLVALGRLRVERGRIAAAEAILGEAVDAARGAGDEGLVTRALAWQAAARADAARLPEAEALCRALLSSGASGPSGRFHAAATLSRVLLWQGRIEEALSILPDGACDDEEVRVYAEAIGVRVRLAAGEIFSAGRRALSLADATASQAGPLVRLVALTGLLRVALAGGDLALGRRRLDEIDGLARTVRSPLRAVRARLPWADALARAGLVREARQEIDRLLRRRKALPPLLRRAVETQAAWLPAAGPAMASRRAWRLATALVSAANGARGDADAAADVAERARAMLGAGRVDLLGGAVEPSSAKTAHSGEPPLGDRVLDGGMPLVTNDPAGGTGLGVPIHRGGQIVGALVMTWAPGRPVPADAQDALEAVAAVLAPWVDPVETLPAGAVASMPELVGGSLAMLALRRAVARAARAPFAVLIEGESGTGKELVARALHRLSPRRERPFRDVNCAALPDELVESELFGHVRGAFTGAVVERAGLVEEADGGTIFLDEVVDLSLRAQAKVLRVIQEQEVRRVGGGAARRVDARVVSAANRDLRDEAAAGRFRPDLLYRLDVIRIRVPPLRERLEDVPALARHFWRDAARRVGSMASLDARVVDLLCGYRWPGNVRELQNVIAGLAVQAPPRGRVSPTLLPARLVEPRASRCRPLAEARLQVERELVEAAMVRAGGRRTQAARDLGLSRQGLLKLMVRVGLSPARRTR